MEYSKEHGRFYCYCEFKRGKNAKEITNALQFVWNEVSPSYATVKRWISDFKSGVREGFEDKIRSGRPSSSNTDGSNAAIQSLVDENPHTSVSELSIATSLSESTVWRILTNSLNLHKVASYWIPKCLTDSQKEKRLLHAINIRDRLLEMGDLRYDNYAVVDETWVKYDKENTKSNCYAWIPKDAKRLQIVSNKLTPRKCLAVIAFTANKRFSVRVLPYGETMDGEKYLDFLKTTADKWRTLRNNPINFRQIVWQQDNARPHLKQCVKEFFESRGTELLVQPPYSPDLNLCDRWLNNFLKKWLRQIEFGSADEVEKEIVKILRSTDEQVFRKEIDSLLKHCGKVIEVNGAYVTPS